MKLKLFKIDGTESGDVELNDDVFGIKPHRQAMFDAIIAQQSSLRQGTHKTKTKGEVSGGGRKPFRQKGTGRARAGSTRSPVWVGGGTVFGPQPNQNYKKQVNKKVRKLALKSVLSVKAKEGNLIVLDNVKFDTPSTKAFANMLNALKSDRRTLLALDKMDDIVKKSGNNIKNAEVLEAKSLNVLAIAKAQKLMITKSAIKVIEEALA